MNTGLKFDPRLVLEFFEMGSKIVTQTQNFHANFGMVSLQFLAFWIITN